MEIEIKQSRNGDSPKPDGEKQVYPVFTEGVGDLEALYMPEEGIHYEITGLTANEYGVKCVIALYHKEKVVNKNLVAIYSARSRTEFCNRSNGIHPKRVEKHLLDLEAELKKLLKKKTPEGQQKKKKEYVMTEEEKDEALEFLKEQNLFDNIKGDLTLMGLVGEETNKLLVYLIASSRKLESPLSGIVKAQSASGKSQLIKSVVALMPPEDVLDVSRITENALFWVGSQDLKYKLITIAEKEGSDTANYPIRILQSEKKLRLLAPQKGTDDEIIRTKEIEVEGPVAFLESTTRTNIDWENATRLFEIYVNESEKQTQIIQNFQKLSRTIEWQTMHKLNSDSIIRKHQNAQRLLRPLRVIIPFAQHIQFPTKFVRTRRDMSRFLDLITVVAFVRQFQKETQTDVTVGEYVEADVADYKVAYELAIDVLGNSLDELDKRSRELLGHIQEMIKDLSDSGLYDEANEIIFGRRDIQKWMLKNGISMSQQLLCLYIRPLEDNEFLTIVTGGKGKTTTYKMPTDDEGNIEKPQPLKGLSTPDQLAKLCQRPTKPKKEAVKPSKTAFSTKK